MDTLVGFKGADGVESPGGSFVYGPDNEGLFLVGPAFREHAVDGVIYVSDRELIEGLDDFPGVERADGPAPEGAKAIESNLPKQENEGTDPPGVGAIPQGGEQTVEQAQPIGAAPTQRLSTVTALDHPGFSELVKHTEAEEAEARKAVEEANATADHGDDDDTDEESEE